MMPGAIASACCIWPPLPFVAMPRTGTGSERHLLAGMVGPCTTSHGPTAHAYRYVGSGLVGWNVTVLNPSGALLSPACAVLATAASDAGTVSVNVIGTLKSGSSKHGKASRALIGSICVIA